jgi:hypothetical protein
MLHKPGGRLIKISRKVITLSSEMAIEVDL